MHQPEFEKAVREQIDRSQVMLLHKNDHYNPGEDKLAAFKRAAALKGETPQKALAGMMVKHTTSVYDLCDAETPAPLAVWDEKITDHINYLLLCRALIQEQHDMQTTEFHFRHPATISAEEVRNHLAVSQD